MSYEAFEAAQIMGTEFMCITSISGLMYMYILCGAHAAAWVMEPAVSILLLVCFINSILLVDVWSLHGVQEPLCLSHHLFLPVHDIDTLGQPFE